MADADTQRFHCPTCRKKYRWTAELAGRKVKCAGCDSKLRVPNLGGGKADLLEAPPPPPEVEPAGDSASMYDLDLSDSKAQKVNPGPGNSAASKANRGSCPNCNSAVKPGAVLCLNCGFNFAEGKVMQTVVAADGAGAPPPPKGKPIGGMLAQASIRKGVDAEALAEDAARANVMSNVYVPLILIGAGLVLVLINAFLLGPLSYQAALSSGMTPMLSSMQNSIYWLVSAVVRLIIQVPILVAGIFIVAAMFGNSYGTLGIAMLKLLAIGLLTGATGDSTTLLLDVVTGGFGGIGYMITFSVIAAVFYATAMPLLEMDILEALVLFLILIFAPFVIMVFVGGLLYSMF